jgi:hypothetical protein
MYAAWSLFICIELTPFVHFIAGCTFIQRFKHLGSRVDKAIRLMEPHCHSACLRRPVIWLPLSADRGILPPATEAQR